MERIRSNNFLPDESEDQSAKNTKTTNVIHKRFHSEDNESIRSYFLKALQD